MSNGITPTLAELIGLRNLVQGHRAARRGRLGVQGHALSNLRGRGMEYAESREYAIGDDARHIDWRLTARSGKPHTKLFQAERERLTLLVADTAATLYFGTRTRFKSVQAARAGALAAWLAVRDGDRIAALRGSAKEAPIAPAAGPRGALRVLDALVHWYTEQPEDDQGLRIALDHARRLLRPGSRLIALADPSSVASIPMESWAALGLHNDASVVMLVDPLERRPPKARLPFRSSEDERIELGLDMANVRQRWKQSFEGDLERAMETLKRSGVRATTLATDEPSDAWLPLLDAPKAVAIR